MRTRHNMPLLSEARKPELVKAVKDKLAVEAATRARGERVLLRDPTGRSLISHILERNPDEAFHFTEDSMATYNPPVFGWTHDLVFMQQHAPEVSLYLIHQHWEHRLLGAGNQRTRTILDDAMSRVQEIDRLVTLAYHENRLGNEPRSGQPAGKQRSVLFKFSAPASFRVGVVYHVWAECSVSDLPGFHPFVCRILRCGCTCPIGSGGDCVHLLMLLLIIHFLPRPVGINVSKPCTSLKCAWMDPGQGDTWSVTTPVHNIPFIRLASKKTKKGVVNAASNTGPQAPGGSAVGTSGPRSQQHSYCPAADVAGYRANYNPYADRDKPRIRGEVNDPARVALFRRLLDAAAEANGEPSAMELAFGKRTQGAARRERQD